MVWIQPTIEFRILVDMRLSGLLETARRSVTGMLSWCGPACIPVNVSPGPRATRVGKFSRAYSHNRPVTCVQFWQLISFSARGQRKDRWEFAESSELWAGILGQSKESVASPRAIVST